MKWKDNAVRTPETYTNLLAAFDLYIHIGFFQAQIEKSDIAKRPLPPAMDTPGARTAQEIDDMEEKLKDHEKRITDMNNYYEKLQHTYLQLTELRHVLIESSPFFEQVCNISIDICIFTPINL
jgi:hypothetical protein